MNLPVIGEVNISSFVIFAIAMLYVASPIDLVPDFIPILGWIDDIIALIIGVKAILGDRDKNG